MHACLARWPVTTPRGFLPLPSQPDFQAASPPSNSTGSDFATVVGCTYWLRLATDSGVAVSIAGAVAAALRDQPPLPQQQHQHDRGNRSYDRLDTRYRPDMDRSYLFAPYPSEGHWYLSLYTECYSAEPSYCAEILGIGIDAAIVVRTKACIDFRCREIGEPPTVTPSRVMDTNVRQTVQLLGQPYPFGVSPRTRWRPEWWWDQLRASYLHHSVAKRSRNASHSDSLLESRVQPPNAPFDLSLLYAPYHRLAVVLETYRKAGLHTPGT
ncbi:unnamed protein product [Protopolystoma xenopodis]|uniref:Uncharacterized protein n=1 Tax=Protopolystoma xenopodis TaxID=117903 RepID=A0A448XLL1_9PLAT|nr:unnamed protein product [Protopolystoma xenopodis]